ncbi:MAG TPA: polysaccharide deacetylase family protein [Burkholderiales bacterium]|jgi:peptidoglycan/xylan/chitin deacetylase (PgdA/CDA1 family)|nr:polysaccharide deacetylase family protein [Burkholderiales bacterium]
MRRASRAAARVTALLTTLIFAAPAVAQDACKGTVYLTIDTGSMSQAELIAATLNKYQVKATFFLANEPTIKGDYTLDPGWAAYWKARAAEGHHFGSHTFDHVYFKAGDVNNSAGDKVHARPQFGREAGKAQIWDAGQVCAELDQVKTRFHEMTGATLQPLWRAPGGYVTANTRKWAAACGYAHVGWSAAGFLGDELPSESYPNSALLKRALANIKNGDVLMMHTGIRSRKDPFAPMLDPLIAGLKARGMCFGLVPDSGYQGR